MDDAQLETSNPSQWQAVKLSLFQEALVLGDFFYSKSKQRLRSVVSIFRLDVGHGSFPSR